MEESITPMTIEEAKRLNPLTLAYIGDAIFSYFVREKLVLSGKQSVHQLTKSSNRYENARSQAQMAVSLLPELTEIERYFLKRGRNTSSQPPKNAKVIDYRRATGFECLLGYLKLTNQTHRLWELMEKSIHCLDSEIRQATATKHESTYEI
ncbi:MAG: ribonuclease III [Eubacteriaceae bacterium]|jgi:ribonuclease-3 family protein|nr:ribonuclease III [Eubacteriaceae bacterium]